MINNLLLDLCESNNDCQNNYVCQASSSQKHRICKPGRKSTCKTFFEANGYCALEQEGKNKAFSSHMFQRIEESNIDRRMEAKILKAAVVFLNNYDTDNDNSYEDYSTVYWTGGQVIKSVEKQVRVWNWRTSQTDVNLGLIIQEGAEGGYLSAKENHCLSVNFRNKTRDFAEFKDVWGASACYEDKKFICELPGTFTIKSHIILVGVGGSVCQNHFLPGRVKQINYHLSSESCTVHCYPYGTCQYKTQYIILPTT